MTPAIVRCPFYEIESIFEVDDPNQHIQRYWSMGIFYEASGMLADLHERYGDNPPAVVWDIGACIGNHTVWFALAFGAQVVAVEPYAPYREHLKRNLATNGVGSRARVLPVAVGAHSHRAAVDVFGGEGMARIIPGDEVDVITLDDIGGPDPDLVKIDIEGCEMAALSGGRRMLDCRPTLLIEGDRIAMERWGEENGYRVAASFNATPTHRLEPI